MHGERSLLHRFGRSFSSRFQRGAWPLSAIRGWLFSYDDLERSSCNHQPSGAHPPLILVAKRAADHASTTQASPKSVPARGHADARMSATTDMARMRIGGAEGMMKAAAIDMAERAPRPALSEGTIQALPRLRAACAKNPAIKQLCLFGSRARGADTASSDFDFFAVLDLDHPVLVHHT